MKTQKLIVTFVSLFMLITSCSKNDDQILTTQKPTYLLSKINYSATSNNTFSYDENNRLIENILTNGNSVYKTTFKYNTKGKISETLAKTISGTNQSIKKIAYMYDAQDRLIEKKLFQESVVFPNLFIYDSSDTFTYNANKIEHKYTKANASLATSRAIVELDSNGNFLNITRYKNISASNPFGNEDWNITMEYDTKNSPFSSIPDEYFFLEKTKNNQTKVTRTISATISAPAVITTAYEYNADGYPTKSTSVNNVITFEYIIK